MNTQYSEEVLHYFFNTKHMGSLDPGPDVFCVKQGQLENGDVIEIYVRATDEKVMVARFKAYGSPVTIACCEYICQFIEGKSFHEIKNINSDHMMKALNLSKFKIHITYLIEAALKKLFISRI